jgi:DNA modification methylase
MSDCQPVEIHCGDALEVLRTLPAGSVNCCVTSPPYYGLRDYGHAGQIGLEGAPAAYVARLVGVFREVRRVLADDGTLWLNLGDSYATRGGVSCRSEGRAGFDENGRERRGQPAGFGHKQLMGIPWRVAFALQDDGWYLRQDIIWHKPNPMPESVRDRCTKAHEYLFLLSKRERYAFDADSIREPSARPDLAGKSRNMRKRGAGETMRGDIGREGIAYCNPLGRNRRSVWTVPPRPYKGAHFAVMPAELVRPCIRAGCKPGGVVLDPFGGSGTVGQVAIEEGRRAVLVELNPDYVPLIRERIGKAEPMGSELYG